jgi:tetratricopeptide (TPR) repeat protein
LAQAFMLESRQAAEAALQAVGDNLHLLGWERRNSGAPELALPLYAAALAIYEVVLGPSHPQAASTIVNLGNALFDQGRHADAAELYRRSLAIDEEALGDDHPDVAMDLSNLGIVYRNMGHTPQAIALFDRAHELLVRALGAEHPSTLTVSRNLSKLRAIADETPRDEAAGAPAAAASRLESATAAGSTLTPRALAEEVTLTLDEDTYIEQAEVVGAHLLHEHVAEARADAGYGPSKVDPSRATSPSRAGVGAQPW